MDAASLQQALTAACENLDSLRVRCALQAVLFNLVRSPYVSQLAEW
jgi:hypothetical protein